jgi:hypothetical protein
MQFGGALHRVLRRVRHADPKYGPVYLSKHDSKDGFYQVFLKADDCIRLAIILPKYKEEPQLIAVPMAATMGWTESPPMFSVMSETVADSPPPTGRARILTGRLLPGPFTPRRRRHFRHLAPASSQPQDACGARGAYAVSAV